MITKKNTKKHTDIIINLVILLIFVYTFYKISFNTLCSISLQL